MTVGKLSQVSRWGTGGSGFTGIGCSGFTVFRASVGIGVIDWGARWAAWSLRGRAVN